MAMRALAISAIVLVAVIMGMSAVVPMIPQAEAHTGGDLLPRRMCDALSQIPPPIPPGIQHLLTHCPLI